MKKDNAITLIALILTIIVLLILSGVAINTLTNTGIFERTKKARDKWKNAQEDEEIQIAKYSNDIENYIDSNRNTLNTNYSLDEHIIGKLNNKDIYEKSIIAKTPTVNSSKIITISNIDELLYITGKIAYNSSDIGDVPVPNFMTAFYRVLNTDNINFVTNDDIYLNKDCILTIHYTKVSN